MDILVFGAGAMGSFFGGILSRTNRVTLVCRRDHADAVRRAGLRITGKTTFVAHPRVATDVSRIRHADLVLVSVKAYDTEVAARALHRFRLASTWVTLQNGLENADVLSRYATKVVAGTTSHGVTFVRPGVIRHAGVGETTIGAYSGVGEADVVQIRNVFQKSGIRARVTRNVRRNIWSKVIVNAGINPLAALTGLRNGELVTVMPLRRALTDLCSEAAAVARAEGYEITDEEATRLAIRIARRTRDNKASMLQDVERRRRTEIDAITGAILRAADRHGLPVPVNRTAHALVDGLEWSYRPRA